MNIYRENDDNDDDDYDDDHDDDDDDRSIGALSDTDDDDDDEEVNLCIIKGQYRTSKEKNDSQYFSTDNVIDCH